MTLSFLKSGCSKALKYFNLKWYRSNVSWLVPVCELSLKFYKETHEKWAEERLIVDPDL